MIWKLGESSMDSKKTIGQVWALSDLLDNHLMVLL